MKRAFFLVIITAVIFSGCTVFNLKYKEDTIYISDSMKEGKELDLSNDTTGAPVDIRDFAASQYRYYIVEGKQRARVNIYDTLANYLTSIEEYGEDEGSGKLEFPVSISLFPENNIIYILDSVARKIHIYSADGRYLKEFYDFSDDDEEYPYYPILLKKNSISGFLMIVDTYNSRILEINESGTVVMRITDGGSESGKLNFPQSVTADDYGNYYVPDGAFIKVYSSRGDHQYNIKNSRFGNLTDVCIWRSRYLVTTDNKNNKVHFLSLQGNYIFGTSQAIAGESFERPYRVFSDESEMLYIVDNLMGKVFVY